MTHKSTSSLLACLLATALGVSACAGGGTTTQQTQHSSQVKNVAWKSRGEPVAPAEVTPEDRARLNDNNPDLSAGDLVKVTTFGHEDLSGEFKVENNGNINLPLIGNVKAEGRSKDELESAIRQKLASGYLVDPKVSVEVANFRQFYIVGEVDEPGAYDYVPSLNILKAVAIAGGFTHRAVTDDFVILRRRDGGEQKLAATDDSMVLPGDTVRVDERFF